MNQLVRHLKVADLEITPTIGAEVLGLDLAQPLDAATVGHLRAALLASDYWPAVRRMERVTVIGDRPA